MPELNADQRIKLAIGEQFVTIETLKDKLAQALALIAERDAEIAELTKQADV